LPQHIAIKITVFISTRRARRLPRWHTCHPMRNPRPASQEATPQHDVAAKHVGQDEAGITEQRARAQTTFCLTRYPATAASRLISSSPLSCPWS